MIFPVPRLQTRTSWVGTPGWRECQGSKEALGRKLEKRSEDTRGSSVWCHLCGVTQVLHRTGGHRSRWSKRRYYYGQHSPPLPSFKSKVLVSPSSSDQPQCLQGSNRLMSSQAEIITYPQSICIPGFPFLSTLRSILAARHCFSGWTT